MKKGIETATATNRGDYELLIKAYKAACRFDAQLMKVLERKEGLYTRISDSTIEEDMELLKRRENWAKHQILVFNSQVRVLKRYYDLEKSSEVREMIYDFLDRVNRFCYEKGKAIGE